MEQQSLLVEIRCEELPPAQVSSLAEQFPARLLAALQKAGFAGETAARAADENGNPYLLATPRRFAALLNGISDTAATTTQRRRGPAVAACYNADNTPTKALLGFMQSVGAADVSALVEISDKGKRYLAFDETRGGATLADTLASIVEDILLSLPAPRLMRWGENTFKFIRPVRGVLLLFGAQAIDGSVLGVAAATAATSCGHPVLAPDPLRIPAADTYPQVLEKKGAVLADIRKRRRAVVEQLNSSASYSPALVDEVTAMCEQPAVYCGKLGDEFLTLPAFCVEECMVKHQRAFPIYKDNTLTAAYRFVADNRPPDPAALISGMNTVLTARLSDVAFYITEDKQLTLDKALDKLSHIVYHHRLGSQRERVSRLTAIALAIGEQLALSADALSRLEQAARACKSDLSTLMIAEYPALEGLMAAYYFCNEMPDIAELVRHHTSRDWKTSSSAVSSPDSLCALLLACNMEKLAAMFAVGELPSGSKDPHGLRHAAAAVADILSNSGDGYRLSLEQLLGITAATFSATTPDCPPLPRERLYDFISERKRQELLEQQFPAVALNAVMALPQSYLADIENKAAALRDFMQQPAAAVLIEAHKRISNILRKSETAALPADINPTLLEAGAESDLHTALLAAEQFATTEARNYPRILAHMATMHDNINVFFDTVLVNHPDTAVRQNRLALLFQLRAFFNTIGDLSKLAGG